MRLTFTLLALSFTSQLLGAAGPSDAYVIANGRIDLFD